MPGSKTTPGRNRPRGFATVRIAFRHRDVVGARDKKLSRLNGWPMLLLPTLRRRPRDRTAHRLGAGVVRETASP